MISSVRITGCSIAMLCFFMWSFPAEGQTWRRAYGALDIDECHSVRSISPEVSIAAGSTGSFGSGSSDIYLITVDGDGVPLWSRTIGGGGVDQCTDAAVSGGSIYITGYTNSSGAGGYDGLVVSIDASGTVLWERTYGGPDWDLLNDVTLLSDGGLLVAGVTYSGHPAGSAWLLRLNAEGDTLWTRTYAGTTGHEAHSAKPTTDGGFVLAGSVVVNSDDRDALIIKLDEEGHEVWRNTYGGDSLDVGRDIIQTMDGGYSVVGITESYSTWKEGYHFRTDAQGEQLWYWNWGQINDQEIHEHYELPNGDFISVGYTKTSGGGGKDMFLMRNQPNGDFVFGRTFGGSEDEIGYSMDILDDGYICGGVTNSYGAGGSDVFLVRTGEDGTTSSESVTTAFDPLSTTEREITRTVVHPNPSTGRIEFAPLNERTRLSVLDASGRQLQETELLQGSTSTALRVSTGSYQLIFRSADGHIRRSKVVITRP
ncbi:MAG: T9SS type A sorting domain-containing protein [Flavobacteriales bacterium]|nr:T9SS type A sorting domain-containing protein [Flavobacteriales bacterium]